MRKALPYILMIILLCSCSGGESARKEKDLAGHYGQITGMAVRAVVRTEFPDRVVDFTVEYTFRAGGAGHMKVIAPEAIAGIEADVSDDGVTLLYDGMSLEIGELPGTGLSPMESLPFMISQWTSGYCTGTNTEKVGSRELLCARYRLTEGENVIEQTSLFDPDTLAPVRSELYVDGALVVSADFTGGGE